MCGKIKLDKEEYPHVYVSSGHCTKVRLKYETDDQLFGMFINC